VNAFVIKLGQAAAHSYLEKHASNDKKLFTRIIQKAPIKRLKAFEKSVFAKGYTANKRMAPRYLEVEEAAKDARIAKQGTKPTISEQWDSYNRINRIGLIRSKVNDYRKIEPYRP